MFITNGQNDKVTLRLLIECEAEASIIQISVDNQFAIQ